VTSRRESGGRACALGVAAGAGTRIAVADRSGS
jgi:hypothetical protein